MNVNNVRKFWKILENLKLSLFKVNASTRTILVTFFWGLFWGLFPIWRLFWRLFLQKIIARMKIVSKIVFKQKINLKISLWENSHQNSPGRCVHLYKVNFLYFLFIQKAWVLLSIHVKLAVSVLSTTLQPTWLPKRSTIWVWVKSLE